MDNYFKAEDYKPKHNVDLYLTRAELGEDLYFLGLGRYIEDKFCDIYNQPLKNQNNIIWGYAEMQLDENRTRPVFPIVSTSFHRIKGIHGIHGCPFIFPCGYKGPAVKCDQIVDITELLQIQFVSRKYANQRDGDIFGLGVVLNTGKHASYMYILAYHKPSEHKDNIDKEEKEFIKLCETKRQQLINHIGSA